MSLICYPFAKARAAMRRGESDDRLLRSRQLSPRALDEIAGGAALVRSWSHMVLRLQPRGGGALLPAGGRRQPRLRPRPLGHRLRGRAGLQQAMEGLRYGRPEELAR